MKKESQNDETEELSFDLPISLRPCIPAGVYEAIFVRAEQKKMWTKTKLFLWFQIITSGDYHGVQLYLVCNLPQIITNSSKYCRTWAKAKGRQPDRRDRMTTNVFRGKAFQVLVRTVTTTSKQRELPPQSHYSVIEEIIQKETE